MKQQFEAISTSLSSFAIDETKIIKIQKWFRMHFEIKTITFNYV